ncbi:30S ribosome-binding factor RbfA [candidate division WOR-3 bacterium]|nr:30S ribosome-binding factor RbfA [candidate division WOR-3 bacterium]
MEDRRNRRIEKWFQQEIARILSERGDPEIGFVTVTRTTLNKKRNKLLCYVSFLTDREAGLSALRKARVSIKTEIAKLARLRFMPDIDFVIDGELPSSVNTL